MAGQGTSGLVQAGTLLPYHIDFENETNATAPAQRVVITDQLTNTLDWTTFELTEMQFGDQYIFLPTGTQSFQTNMPVTINGASFVVQIQAGLNPANGKFTTTLQSIDPTTGLPPAANVGFLPPEDGFGRGRGQVAYLVRPKSNIPSGTQIRNTALVQFDNGEIIETDQVAEHDPSQGVDPAKQALVTVDSALPTSSISGLPTVTTNTTFTVCWTASDNFSTITGYDIYVSTNSGPWTLWLTNTTNTCALFSGQFGSQYGFFSVAHNSLGYSGVPPYGSGMGTIVATHLAPQITGVPNQSIAVGQRLTITNTAQDPDKPITFSLGQGAAGRCRYKQHQRCIHLGAIVFTSKLNKHYYCLGDRQLCHPVEQFGEFCCRRERMPPSRRRFHGYASGNHKQRARQRHFDAWPYQSQLFLGVSNQPLHQLGLDSQQ